MSKTRQRKEQEVEQIAKLMKEYDIVGIANIESLPAPQLGRMRSLMREDVQIIVIKKTLIRRAIAAAKAQKKGIEQLEERMVGMPALIFTKQNPFKLASILRKNKSRAPAKPGQSAPNDIIIPAGPTPFAPGPIISELGAVGLKTGVEGGKVAVKEDKQVASEGDVIDAKLASVLSKLGIEPMEIGLNLVAVYDAGVIYGKDVLSVDESHYTQQLAAAAVESLGLALHLGYATDATIKPLIARAFREAKELALSQDILSDEAIKKWIGQADRAASALSAGIPDAPAGEATTAPASEEKKTEEAEENKETEKAQEAKPEGKA